MTHVLLLGSSSASRQELLTQAGIPFMCVTQEADESQCDWGMGLQQVVESIAVHKMEHVQMPLGVQGEKRYVLTADTLSQDSAGNISGKPVSREDAVEKIKAARAGMRTGTAFCIDVRVYQDGVWQVTHRIVRFVDATYVFNVPDAWLERYFEHSRGFVASGAIAIEGYGTLFLESIQGSYATIVGLPLFEVRRELELVGFFAL